MDTDVQELIQEFLEGAPHRNIEAEVLELSSPGIQNQFKAMSDALTTLDGSEKAG
jgi:ribosome maturation factor RimP